MENLDKQLELIFKKDVDIPGQLTQKIKKAIDQKDKTKRRIIYCKIRNVTVAMLVIALLGLATPDIYAQIKWNIEYKEFENRPVEYGMASIKKMDTKKT